MICLSMLISVSIVLTDLASVCACWCHLMCVISSHVISHQITSPLFGAPLLAPGGICLHLPTHTATVVHSKLPHHCGPMCNVHTHIL